MTTRVGLVLLAMALLLALASCGSALRSALATTSAAGDRWLEAVEGRYRAEQMAVVGDPELSTAETQLALAEVRARYRPLWAAWDAFQGAWDAAAACEQTCGPEEQDRAAAGLAAALSSLALIADGLFEEQ